MYFFEAILESPVQSFQFQSLSFPAKIRKKSDYQPTIIVKFVYSGGKADIYGRKS